MSRIGLLTFDGGISRLSGTRLMRGAIDNGGFSRATNFLQQTRQLFDNEIISVDGSDALFGGMPVIVITDAQRVGFAVMAVAVPGGTKTAAKGTKASAKKGGAKKGTKKSGSKKSGAKKAGAKKAGAKKAAGK